MGLQSRLRTWPAVASPILPAAWGQWRVWRAHGLGSPYYIIDVIAFALLFAGIVRSLRARPRMAPGVLTAGCGWPGANFWRATFDRIGTLQRGGTLDMGSLELRFVCGELVVSPLCLGVRLALLFGSQVEPCKSPSRLLSLASLETATAIEQTTESTEDSENTLDWFSVLSVTSVVCSFCPARAP